MKSEWQDISTAPKDGTLIIGFLPDEHGDEVWLIKWEEEDEDGESGWYDNYGGDYKPTHWMPYVKPVKLHLCKKGDYECHQSLTNTLLYLRRGYPASAILECTYCPICGERA